jgi:hypothetical protein
MSADQYNDPCLPDQRWVCGACGRTSEPGGKRYDLHDSSCIMHAVLCHADQRDGIWHAVTGNDTQ